jgi:dienelactone hydrolase
VANVILFHSSLGLTDDTHQWADGLRDQGHDVVTPDLFGGTTFDTIEAGVKKVDSKPMSEYIAAARAALADVEGPRVYAGFSFGAVIAEYFALTDADATAAVLIDGAISPSWFDITDWPAGLRVQLHYMGDDEWVEAEEVSAFKALAPKRAVEEHVYDGDAHLYALAGFDNYDEQAAELTFERITEFLDGL